ncbi:MAG: hypothetical protein ACKN9W_09855 [Methylococcus sp.]
MLYSGKIVAGIHVFTHARHPHQALSAPLENLATFESLAEGLRPTAPH